MVTFIIKSTIVFGCSYGFYYLLFRRSRSFSFIRFFLLFSMIIAVTIPFIEIRRGLLVREGYGLWVRLC